ncbi:hypothetical protein CYY_010070 [Polysphondylium violaceum]|uniref:Uncharacterized protein n=1 Tax=Polysphondylium violaceum TaxID=133409 RepID=A0A8J4PJJ6_9MYCE|nr:hypothetical protein CYY_010070 [Polysphondylium violaceum]
MDDIDNNIDNIKFLKENINYFGLANYLNQLYKDCLLIKDFTSFKIFLDTNNNNLEFKKIDQSKCQFLYKLFQYSLNNRDLKTLEISLRLFKSMNPISFVMFKYQSFYQGDKNLVRQYLNYLCEKDKQWELNLNWYQMLIKTIELNNIDYIDIFLSCLVGRSGKGKRKDKDKEKNKFKFGSHPIHKVIQYGNVEMLEFLHYSFNSNFDWNDCQLYRTYFISPHILNHDIFLFLKNVAKTELYLGHIFLALQHCDVRLWKSLQRVVEYMGNTVKEVGEFIVQSNNPILLSYFLKQFPHIFNDCLTQFSSRMYYTATGTNYSDYFDVTNQIYRYARENGVSLTPGQKLKFVHDCYNHLSNLVKRGAIEQLLDNGEIDQVNSILVQLKEVSYKYRSYSQKEFEGFYESLGKFGDLSLIEEIVARLDISEINRFGLIGSGATEGNHLSIVLHFDTFISVYNIIHHYEIFKHFYNTRKLDEIKLYGNLSDRFNWSAMKDIYTGNTNNRTMVETLKHTLTRYFVYYNLRYSIYLPLKPCSIEMKSTNLILKQILNLFN